MLSSPTRDSHEWITGEDCPKCAAGMACNEIVSHDPVNADAAVKCGRCGHQWHARDRFISPEGRSFFVTGEAAPPL